MIQQSNMDLTEWSFMKSLKCVRFHIFPVTYTRGRNQAPYLLKIYPLGSAIPTSTSEKHVGNLVGTDNEIKHKNDW